MHACMHMCMHTHMQVLARHMQKMHTHAHAHARLAGRERQCFVRAILNALPGPQGFHNPIIVNAFWVRVDGRDEKVTQDGLLVGQDAAIEHFKSKGIVLKTVTGVRGDKIIKHVCAAGTKGNFVALEGGGNHAVAIRASDDPPVLVDPGRKRKHKLCEQAFKNCNLDNFVKLFAVTMEGKSRAAAQKDKRSQNSTGTESSRGPESAARGGVGAKQRRRRQPRAVQKASKRGKKRKEAPNEKPKKAEEAKEAADEKGKDAEAAPKKTKRKPSGRTRVTRRARETGVMTWEMVVEKTKKASGSGGESGEEAKEAQSAKSAKASRRSKRVEEKRTEQRAAPVSRGQPARKKRRSGAQQICPT